MPSARPVMNDPWGELALVVRRALSRRLSSGRWRSRHAARAAPLPPVDPTRARGETAGADSVGRRTTRSTRDPHRSPPDAHDRTGRRPVARPTAGRRPGPGERPRPLAGARSSHARRTVVPATRRARRVRLLVDRLGLASGRRVPRPRRVGGRLVRRRGRAARDLGRGGPTHVRASSNGSAPAPRVRSGRTMCTES